MKDIRNLILIMGLFSSCKFLYAMELEKPHIDYLIQKDCEKYCDDKRRWISVPKTLFLGLCLNAQHDEDRNKKSFQEVLQRVKESIIDSSKNEVLLTQKEFFAGLVSHIKYANHSMESKDGQIFDVIICGQNVWMSFGPNMYNPIHVKAQNFDSYNTKKIKKLESEFEALLNQTQSTD